MNQIIANSTAAQWTAAASILAGALVAFWIVQRLVVANFARFARSTSSGLDDLVAHVLGRTKFLLFLVVAVFFASLSLTLPVEIAVVLQRAAEIAVVLQAGVWATSGIGFWVDRFRQQELEEDAATVTTVGALAFLARVGVWVVVFLLILDNLGVEVTALITGLGIGGIAIALAVQNILGDLFASLSIVLDKPFVLGDFLRVGDDIGTVEHIGLKTTRLRALTGEQLIVANGDLLESRVRNFGRLFERRGTLNLGVTYQTPREVLERIPGMIQNAIERQDDGRFDRSHFKAYGAYSLDFEAVFWVTRPEYAVFMDVQQAILLDIHRQFEEAGVEFAYPTQVVYAQGLAETPAE